MRLLTIDTSTRIGTVAAIDGEQILQALDSTEQLRHAERLLDLVHEVLGSAGWQLPDVELVACGMGPGSFTGVRVGMATAKGLCSAAGLPLLGVVSLEAMAHAARHLSGPAPVAAMLDAKKAEVFVAVYGADATLIAGPAHVPAPHVQAWLQGIDPAAGAGLRVVGEIAAGLELGDMARLRHPLSDLPCAASMAALAQDAWLVAPRSQLHDLEPLYVRPPDIQLPGGRL